MASLEVAGDGAAVELRDARTEVRPARARKKAAFALIQTFDDFAAYRERRSGGDPSLDGTSPGFRAAAVDYFDAEVEWASAEQRLTSAIEGFARVHGHNPWDLPGVSG